MSRDMLTVGSTMRISLLYRAEYSQWVESNKTAKDLWDALARHMLGSEYGEQDRKAVVLYEYETFKATEGELLLDHHLEVNEWWSVRSPTIVNMNFVDYETKELPDSDLCLIMASQSLCDTSVEDLKHCAPWLYKVLGEERTHFVK
nr:hypothetical protein [Tanacetum cinerariifolium]